MITPATAPPLPQSALPRNPVSTARMADLYGINMRTIQRLAAAGRIDGAIKYEGRWWFPRGLRILPPDIPPGRPKKESV